MVVHSQEETTDVIEATGKLFMNSMPQANFVNRYAPIDIAREVPAYWYGRFENAFVAVSSSIS